MIDKLIKELGIKITDKWTFGYSEYRTFTHNNEHYCISYNEKAPIKWVFSRDIEYIKLDIKYNGNSYADLKKKVIEVLNT